MRQHGRDVQKSRGTAQKETFTKGHDCDSDTRDICKYIAIATAL